MEDEQLDILDNSPGWRWEFIRSMVDNDRTPSRRPEDAPFTRGVRFLKRVNTGKFFDLPALKREYPELTSAYRLFKNNNSERWIVEAGLLTNTTHKEIGEYVAQTEEVVKMYEFYFFDIRDKLTAEGYVINRILTPSGLRNMSQRDYDFMYKSIAYYMGWKAFREFVGGNNFSEDLRTTLLNNFKNRMLALGWKAVQCVGINNFTAIPIIEQMFKMIDIEYQRGGSGNRDEIVAMMGNLLQQCKVTILPYTQSGGPQFELNEPRALQMVQNSRPQLQYGETIPVKGDKHG
jgi:hypothetical protein